jgi:hypothetical protein
MLKKQNNDYDNESDLTESIEDNYSDDDDD